MGRGREQPAQQQQRRQPSVPVVMVTSGVAAVLAAALTTSLLGPSWSEGDTGVAGALPAGFPQGEWQPPGAPAGSVRMGLPRLDAVPAAATSAAGKPGAGGAWLSYLNDIRAAAGAPPVKEGADASKGAAAHAAWMAAAGAVSVAQTPGKPGFTDAGDTAARRSLVLSGADDPVGAIRSWLESPFHAAALTDASLQSVGWGYVRGFAALDVVSGRADSPPVTGWPRAYPSGPGAYPVHTRLGTPDPTVGCPRAASYGAPIIVDYGPGPEIAAATATLRAGADTVPVCVRSASAYAASSWALSASKVVVIPLVPLKTGVRYQGAVTSVRGVAPLDFTTGRVTVTLGWDAAQPRALTPGVPASLRGTITTPDTTAPVAIPVEAWAQVGGQWKQLGSTSARTTDGKGTFTLKITAPASGDVIVACRGSFAARAGYSSALTVKTP